MVNTAAKRAASRQSISNRLRSNQPPSLPSRVSGERSLRLNPSSNGSGGVVGNAKASGSGSGQGGDDSVTSGSKRSRESDSSVEEVIRILSPPAPAVQTGKISTRSSTRPKKGKSFLKAGLWSNTTSDHGSSSTPATMLMMPSGSSTANEASSSRNRLGSTKSEHPSYPPPTPEEQQQQQQAQAQSQSESQSHFPLDPSFASSSTSHQHNNDTHPDLNESGDPPSPSSPSSHPADPNQFPPLPIYWGKSLVEDERDFMLPWDLVRDAEQGVLEGKRLPGSYRKIVKNIYVQRKPFIEEEGKAVCHCQPSSGCKNNCLNRAMNYLCGKDCPSYPNCTNASLALRPAKRYEVFYTGPRGFGIRVLEKVHEGEFIMDYRGEIIELETYFARIRSVYAGNKDFYALDYDMDEVIDAGLKGNDARYINHSCAPNIEVRKYQTAGAGLLEYEIGFWALRDIEPMEELCYNYNFDSFTTYKRPADHPDSLSSAMERRQRCFCGASNCSGWLGKRNGENREASGSGSGSGTAEASTRTKLVEAAKVQKKVFGEDKVKSSRRAGKEKESEKPSTPRGKKRKIDHIQTPPNVKSELIAPESALQKLAQARELALAAAAECGISIDDLVGASNKAPEAIDETTRIARTVYEGLDRFQLAVAGPSRRVEKGKAKAVYDSDSDEDDNDDDMDEIQEEDITVDITLPIGTGKTWRKDLQKGKLPIDESAFYGRIAAAKAKGKMVYINGEPYEGPASMDVVEEEQVLVAPAAPRKPKRGVGRPRLASVVPKRGRKLGQSTLARGRRAKEKVERDEPGEPVPAPRRRGVAKQKKSQPRLAIETKLEAIAQGTKRAKPHAVLAPRRMARSRLALLDDEGLEAERKSRRQGPDWLAAQQEAIHQMHLSIAAGETPPPPYYVTPAKYAATAKKGRHDITVYSLMLDVPFSVTPTSRSLSYKNDWQKDRCEDDDDEKTLVDPADYVTYQRDLLDLLGYVKPGDSDSSEPMEADNIPIHSQTNSSDGTGDSNNAGGADQSRDTGSDQPVDAPGGAGDSAGSNGGGDDGNGNGKGPPNTSSVSIEMDADVEDDDEEAAETGKKAGEDSEMLQIVAESELPVVEAPRSATTEMLVVEPRPVPEQDEQWFQAMQGIVAMQRAQAGHDTAPREIGPEELAAAQLEIYRQEAEGSPRSSHDRDTMTPAFDQYESGQYGSPGSGFGGDEYDQHDDDSYQRYIITHGLSIDEVEWSSVSDMTDLEEMEMNEREIVSTAPDMEKYNRARRARKPRPPRRFKTIITRIRPKLEAAINDIDPAEEDAALERERKRRKKGQAWLNSMKALAQARREAKARQEAGLPPPAFTLPPTSLTPAGQKKRIKKENDPNDTEDQHDAGPSGASAMDEQVSTPVAPKRKKSTAKPNRVRKPSPPVAPLPAYDYQEAPDSQQYLEALGQESYDALLANQGGNPDAGPSSIPSLRVEDSSSNQDYAALMQQAAENAGQASVDDGQQAVDVYYQQSYEEADNNPVSTLVQAASMFSNGQADAYMQNTNFDYTALQSNPYSLPNFAQFQQPAEGSSSGAQLPPVPPLGRSLQGDGYSTPSPGRVPPLSLTVTRTGEKRRRGPPVKKIAGAMPLPLTDEQWELERKKRKKGYAWVQETKAAAEAERLARAQRAAGFPVLPQPRKARGHHLGGGKSIDDDDGYRQDDGNQQGLYDGMEDDDDDLHHPHETLAEAHQQQEHGHQQDMPDPQDDIVPFPSTADDDFPMPGELYEGQEQDMAHYEEHAQNAYGDVHMA